ncbi:hypothetical protein W04_1288 [Pseudoalteromonas sp. SW0106-04]|nr:hypothetical protein W04_1288 [Pseudoalteromonas sp. SW0106-04]
MSAEDENRTSLYVHHLTIYKAFFALKLTWACQNTGKMRITAAS